MRKLFNYFKRLDRSWLITWAFIYVSFMGLAAILPDFFGVTVLRYTGIVLTLIFAMQKFSKDHLLHIALFFTLLADTILVVDSVSILGVLVFCIAQFFHISRFAGTQPIHLTLYILILASFITYGAIEGIDYIYLAGFVYALSLGANIVFAYTWHKNAKSAFSLCAFAGFILFAFCDICVATSYLSHIEFLPAFLYPIANYFAWAFYYPSQILISNSSGLAKSNR